MSCFRIQLCIAFDLAPEFEVENENRPTIMSDLDDLVAFLSDDKPAVSDARH